MESVAKHIGRRIRNLRVFNGYTQTEFGKIIGVTFQQVQKYENGSNHISAENLYLISQKMRVDINYFFEKLHSHDGEAFPDSDLRASSTLQTLLAIQKTKRGRDILKLLKIILDTPKNEPFKHH